MAAYIARISFNTLDEQGNDINVPIGARVEKDDHYYSAYPDAFEEENPKSFFGRVNPANGAVESTTAEPVVLTSLVPEEITQVEPEEKLVEEPVVETTAAVTPKSSVGRRTLPRK